MPKITKSHFAMLIAVSATSWASIFIRLANVPPFVIAFWRLFLSFVGMFLLALLFNQGHEFRNIPRYHYKFLILAGFFLAIHFDSWFLSLSYITIAASVTIVDSAPLFVVLGSFLFIRERIKRIQLLGILISVLGGIIISLDSGNDSLLLIQDPMIGNVLALIGAISVSGYLLIGRSLRQDIGIYAYMTFVYGFCTFFLFIFALLVNPSELIDSFIFQIDLNNYILFLLLAIGPSLLGHTMYNYAIKEIKAAIISVVMLGEPIISSILAVFILQEFPSFWIIIGGSIVILGVGITVWKEESNQVLTENIA
ncbi:MAG: DMT family transporter [Candidatus Thorarchaeota archaeon]